jgi:hypothetical protein
MNEVRKWRVFPGNLSVEGDPTPMLFNSAKTERYVLVIIKRADGRRFTKQDVDFVDEISWRVSGWTHYALEHGGRVTAQALTKKLKEAVVKRDGHKCLVCGCSQLTSLAVHHYVPDLHVLDNLVTLCANCHRLVEALAAKRTRLTRAEFSGQGDYDLLMRIARKTRPLPQAERARAGRRLAEGEG